MAKKRRKNHLNPTVKRVVVDEPLDVPSTIVLYFVGLIAFTYFYFAMVALYKMTVSNG